MYIYIYFFTSLSDLHNQNEIVRNPETSALNGTEEENATLANGFQFDGMENVLTVNKIKIIAVRALALLFIKDRGE